MSSEPIVGAQKRPWNVFILSVRDPRTDFRRELVSALRDLGHSVVYVRLGRKCFVEGPMAGLERWQDPVYLSYNIIRLSICRRRILIINSVNLGFPFYSLILRILTPRSNWIFDLHDDLLYEKKGFTRFFSRLRLKVLMSISSLTICASPKLRDLYPQSVIITNASSVARKSRLDVDARRVLILSNVDNRLDFALLMQVIENNCDVELHLYGGSGNKKSLDKKIRELENTGRLKYHGGYVGSEICNILEEFDIMLVPYRLCGLTDYIDPIRFYHALNNGLEIITTPIPRALDFADRMHLVRSGVEVSSLLMGLSDGTVPLRNRKPHSPITWKLQAVRLIQAVENNQRRSDLDKMKLQ